MEPESALRNWIVSDVTVAALIGTRCYPVELPQIPTLPAVTLTRISYAPKDEIPYPTVRIQATSWATTNGGARALAQAIEDAASKRKGTSLGMTVIYASVLNNLDLHDPETGYHTVPVDFKVTYKEV